MKEILEDALVKKGLVQPADFLFADIKGFERSNQKMCENLEKNKKKQKTEDAGKDIESTLYTLKDLLRGSVITDSAEETIRVFKVLTSLPDANVVQVKNMFNNKN